ncbi:MAG: hypothetical protein RLZZ458_669 [Planctomycetota bacterium]
MAAIRRTESVDFLAQLSGTLMRLVCLFCMFWAIFCGDISAAADPSQQWRVQSVAAGIDVSIAAIEDDGQPLTRFQFRNPGNAGPVVLVAPIEPSRLHFDFSVTLEAESTVRGGRLALQILLPHQQDPRSGKPLLLYLPGDAIAAEESVQKLSLSVSSRSFEALLRRARTELNRSDIRFQEALITGVAFLAESVPGESWLDLADASYGPVIAPPESVLETIQSVQLDVRDSSEDRTFVPLDVELGAIMLSGKPVVLRMIPDHQEHTETLRELGLNAVWIQDYRETDRAKTLWQEHYAVLATPPHPEFQSGDYSTVRRSLPPLDQFCPHVSGWYEGTRVSAAELPHLLAWSREVRSADRVFQRPQMADVAASESAVAREIDLVGLGRHVVGTEDSFGSLRNLLLHRQKIAGQLSFPWTWIQTEPSAAQQLWREGQLQPLIEPEQIQQQVYAALSAGYRGFGYWKTRGLQPDQPHDREISLAIELANLEISLLEPFLARGRREGYLALQTTDSQSTARSSKTRSSLSHALSGTPSGVTVTGLDSPAGHDAAIISSPGATLILAVAWDNASQYVPAPMYEREVSMIVAASETASAWQISTSGVRSLPREVTAGGLAIRIRDFDRSAAVIVTSDTGIIRNLEQQVQAVASRAAAKTLELASLKYVRVLGTIETLREAHTVPAGADRLLAAAREALDRGSYERRNGDHREAALLATDALRNLRLLQHLCWKDAVAELTAPTASPHTISFSTLPEHWKLVRTLREQRDGLSPNLLPGGNFDNQKNLVQEGFTRQISGQNVFSATADLIAGGNTGRLLRLAAWYSDPALKSGTRDDLVPLTISTPQIPVSAGDVMIVRGRVRRGLAVTAGTRRPLLLHDSELGPEQALRPELRKEWTPFELFRPIRKDGLFQFSASLAGQAEVHLDDLEIQRLPAASSGTDSPLRFTGNPAAPTN